MRRVDEMLDVLARSPGIAARPADVSYLLQPCVRRQEHEHRVRTVTKHAGGNLLALFRGRQRVEVVDALAQRLRQRVPGSFSDDDVVVLVERNIEFGLDRAPGGRCGRGRFFGSILLRGFCRGRRRGLVPVILVRLIDDDALVVEVQGWRYQAQDGEKQQRHDQVQPRRPQIALAAPVEILARQEPGLCHQREEGAPHPTVEGDQPAGRIVHEFAQRRQPRVGLLPAGGTERAGRDERRSCGRGWRRQETRRRTCDNYRRPRCRS